MLSNTECEPEQVERLTGIVWLLTELRQDNKQEIVQSVLLQEGNFSSIDSNALPMKMFADLLLSGGVAFDVGQLFKDS